MIIVGVTAEGGEWIGWRNESKCLLDEAGGLLNGRFIEAVVAVLFAEIGTFKFGAEFIRQLT